MRKKPSTSPAKVDCAKFYPEMHPNNRLECGGVFVPFSHPPGGSIVGWCMFCGAQYYVPACQKST